MLRTVKIGQSEYRAIKEVAKKRQQFLTYHLNEAIRQYINKLKSEQQTAEKVA